MLFKKQFHFVSLNVMSFRTKNNKISLNNAALYTTSTARTIHGLFDVFFVTAQSEIQLNLNFKLIKMLCQYFVSLIFSVSTAVM